MAKKRRVAVILELEWPYKRHHEVFAGLMRYAQQRGGWDCIPEAFVEASTAAGRGKRSYDGIIARVSRPLADWARKARVPLVNVWFSSPVKNVPLVAPDFAAAGRMAAEHLMARGFRRFGFLGHGRQEAVKAQLEGFRAAVEESGFSCSTLLVSPRYYEHPENWQRFTAQLDQWVSSWSLPIGVCVSYDLLCRYLACACARCNVRVPHDAALVGTHNEPVICAHPAPSLTSIELGYERVGFRAAELLDSMMNAARPPRRPVYVAPAGLLPRQSTDALVVEDLLVGEALRYIAENSHTKLRVSDVAAALVVERRTLERHFRAALGRSVGSEIARLRVERLKRRLVESDTPIKDLARENGFRDTAQMCALFRRIEGLSPSAYRRKHRRS